MLSWAKNLDFKVVNNIPALRYPLQRQWHIRQHYGWRKLSYSDASTDHKGLDIGASSSEEIRAAADGTVIYSDWCGGYGNYVKIDHGNGLVTAYAHMSKIVAQKGEKVKAGQLIGYPGETGNAQGVHLHYEVYVNGTAVDPFSGYLIWTDYETYRFYPE